MPSGSPDPTLCLDYSDLRAGCVRLGDITAFHECKSLSNFELTCFLQFRQVRPHSCAWKLISILASQGGWDSILDGKQSCLSAQLRDGIFRILGALCWPQLEEPDVLVSHRADRSRKEEVGKGREFVHSDDRMCDKGWQGQRSFSLAQTPQMLLLMFAPSEGACSSYMTFGLRLKSATPCQRFRRACVSACWTSHAVTSLQCVTRSCDVDLLHFLKLSGVSTSAKLDLRMCTCFRQ